jgi:hypothetical protein
VRTRPALSGLFGLSLIVTLGVGSAVAHAAPTSAPAITAISMSTSLTALHSSRHDPLVISVDATRNNLRSLGQSSVSVEIGSPKQVETHTWTFDIPKTALNAKTSGSGTLVVPRANIAPFGTISLRFTSTGKPVKTVCNSNAYSTAQKVTVRGTVFFNTHSTGAHRWGSVGSTSRRFTFRRGSVLVKDFGENLDCPSGSPLPCGYSIIWFVGSANQLVGLEGGTAGKTGGVIDASRTKNLAKPKHASRVDEVVTPAARPTIRTTGADTIAMSIRSAGHDATGSATMYGTSVGPPSPSICGKGKTSTSSGWTATFSNNNPRLVIKEAIFGPITMPNIAKPVAEIIQFGTARAG